MKIIRTAAAALAVALLPLILTSCFFEDELHHLPEQLEYNASIVISRDYSRITVNHTVYTPCDNLGSGNGELLLPADAKMAGALVEGETVDSKTQSREYDAVYFSGLCPGYLWLTTNKDITNNDVFIIGGYYYIYRAEEKDDSNQYRCYAC